MSWFEIQWSAGHVGLDMSNGSGGLNCGGDVIWNICSGNYANIRSLCIIIYKLDRLPEMNAC